MKPFAIQKEDGESWETFTFSRGESDYCTREGAGALKEMIETYWRARGQNVIVALHNVGFHPAIRAARYDVRSDMLNGMPRAVKTNQAAPVQAADIVEVDDDLVSD